MLIKHIWTMTDKRISSYYTDVRQSLRHKSTQTEAKIGLSLWHTKNSFHQMEMCAKITPPLLNELEPQPLTVYYHQHTVQ